VIGATDGAFAGNSNAGSDDIFVRKLDASGATRWTRQIGTAGDDSAQGAVADTAGDLYVVGSRADDFTAPSFDPSSSDAPVLRIPAASALSEIGHHLLSL
jgi:hypothetical protein